MDDRQFQQILDLLGKIQRSLTMTQILAAITLGFLLAVSFTKAF